MFLLVLIEYIFIKIVRLVFIIFGFHDGAAKHWKDMDVIYKLLDKVETKYTIEKLPVTDQRLKNGPFEI